GLPSPMARQSGTFRASGMLDAPLSRSPFDFSASKASARRWPVLVREGKQRPQRSNGGEQIRNGTWPRSDDYLPIVLHRLRRTMATRWGAANRAGHAPVARLGWRT